jgi:hypothetical protein
VRHDYLLRHDYQIKASSATEVITLYNIHPATNSAGLDLGPLAVLSRRQKPCSYDAKYCAPTDRLQLSRLRGLVALLAGFRPLHPRNLQGREFSRGRIVFALLFHAAYRTPV